MRKTSLDGSSLIHIVGASPPLGGTGRLWGVIVVGRLAPPRVLYCVGVSPLHLQSHVVSPVCSEKPALKKLSKNATAIRISHLAEKEGLGSQW